MTQQARAFLAGGMLLVAAAAPARAERFATMKYLGGHPQNRHQQVGSIVLEGGQLRFEDRKGGVVFVLPLSEAKAWIGAEKRTTLGSIFRSSALMMVAIPLSVGQIDPTQAWSRDSKPILVIQLGGAAGGATLRWRGPTGQLSDIAEAINRAAGDVAVLPQAH